MMKPLLLAGACALAVPALAQDAGSGPAPDTPPEASSPIPNDAAPSSDTVGTTQPDVAAPDTSVPPTDSTTSPETDQATPPSTIDTDVNSTTSTDASATSATTRYASAQPAMAKWNFSGNLGRIGSPDYGVSAIARTSGASASYASAGTAANTVPPGDIAADSSAPANTGVGGPLDIDTQWSQISSTGADLTPLDFGVWMLESYGQNVDRQVESTRKSRASNLPAIQVLNMTSGAFSQADANHDMRVSRDELKTFAGPA